MSVTHAIQSLLLSQNIKKDWTSGGLVKFDNSSSLRQLPPCKKPSVHPNVWRQISLFKLVMNRRSPNYIVHCGEVHCPPVCRGGDWGSGERMSPSGSHMLVLVTTDNSLYTVSIRIHFASHVSGTWNQSYKYIHWNSILPTQTRKIWRTE